MRARVEPSPWVVRFAALIRSGGRVLDLACGSGRHARWLAGRGYVVEAVDRNAQALAALAGVAGIHTHCADLEDGPWPYAGKCFDGIVVVNYLYRPRFTELLACVAPGGVLIYETFMQGNERFGQPSNPDFLLRPGELPERLERAGEGFTVVAFEQGETSGQRPVVMQRICALRGAGPAVLP